MTAFPRSSLDKVRDELAASSGPNRSRLRKSASHLVLGRTTGTFKVMMANDMCEVEEEEDGDEEEYGEVLPKAKVRERWLKA